MKKIIIGLLILGSISAPSSHARSFKWCQSISQVPFAELVASKVPNNPANYKRDSRLIRDGEWDFDLPIKDVWTLYTKTPMKKMWNSHYIEHRFTLAPSSKIPNMELNRASGIELGTRMFFDIKAFLTGDVCNMAIGFEVTRIIPFALIQLDYLDFSPPYGRQWMYFQRINANKTKVIQYSQYLGKDLVIQNFYKFFHNEEIPRLHEQLQELAKEL